MRAETSSYDTVCASNSSCTPSLWPVQPPHTWWYVGEPTEPPVYPTHVATTPGMRCGKQKKLKKIRRAVKVRCEVGRTPVDCTHWFLRLHTL